MVVSRFPLLGTHESRLLPAVSRWGNWDGIIPVNSSGVY